MSENADLLHQMRDLGAHLMKLKDQVKEPLGKGWPLAEALTIEAAEAHLARGGNVGVNLASSRMICLDAENNAATNAVVDAGFTLTVIPAKAQANFTFADGSPNPKRGGSHTWLRVPEGIDAFSLRSDRMGITLPSGGVIDILAGGRYAVAPPSRLTEAPEYSYAACQGGPLDAAVYTANPNVELDEAPIWLFTSDVACPPGLEPLHGCLAPKTPYERVEGDARTQELTDGIDSVPWEQWLDGDPRLTSSGEIDGCGCEIWHWQGAEHTKSATLHDNCSQGSGAHIWSGTMIGQLGLGGDHMSRLQLSAKLRGVSEAAAARSVGVQLGGGDSLAPVLPEHYEQSARNAEAAGDTERAALFRQAAAVMSRLRGSNPVAGASREIHGFSPIAGGAPTAVVIPPTSGSPAQSQGRPAVDGATALAPAAQEVAEPIPGPHEVKTFPGVPLSEIPVPGDNDIHQYPMPPIPEGVPIVRGARTEFVEVLPPLANRQSHSTVKHEWIFSATPGLSQVAAAADARGVGRWGMLGALLPRVAAIIPPTVRLIPADGSIPAGDSPTGAGTSINIYTVLVGPPAAGKSVTLSTADTLVPGVHMVPVGTGEGILKVFPRAEDDEDAAADDPARVGSVGSTGASDSVLLSSDEIDVFVAEMERQGTKASGLYRSMWMGGDVGNTTSDRERRSMVGAHTYRFGIRLGAQPDAVAPLFSESDRGTPQRFVWLGCQRMVARGGPYPSRLAIAPVYWHGGEPTMIPRMGVGRPPVWISPPPAARKELAEELWKSATANTMSPSGGYGEMYSLDDRAGAIADRHALLQQLKMCAILGSMDGLAQPQDVHWYAAGAVMAVRRDCIVHLVEVADAVRTAEARKRGKELGIVRSHADAASEQETAARRNDASAAVLVIACDLTERRQPITIETLQTEITTHGGADPSFVTEAVSQMAHSGDLTLTSDGVTYALTLGSDPMAGNVQVLHPAPPIANAGQ